MPIPGIDILSRLRWKPTLNTPNLALKESLISDQDQDQSRPLEIPVGSSKPSRTFHWTYIRNTQSKLQLVRMTQAQKGQTPFANPWEWLAHPKTSLWYPMTHKMRPNKRNLTKWFGESETKAEHFRPESWAQFGPPFTLTHLIWSAPRLLLSSPWGG